MHCPDVATRWSSRLNWFLDRAELAQSLGEVWRWTLQKQAAQLKANVTIWVSMQTRNYSDRKPLGNRRERDVKLKHFQTTKQSLKVPYKDPARSCEQLISDKLFKAAFDHHKVGFTTSLLCVLSDSTDVSCIQLIYTRDRCRLFCVCCFYLCLSKAETTKQTF